MNKRKKSTFLDLEEIGLVEFHRRKKSRSIRVAIFTGNKVRCNFPWQLPMGDAIQFVQKNARVIQNRQQELQRQLQRIQSLLSAPRSKPESEYLLRQRLRTLAGENGFTYASVQFRSQKSRWGSCSETNTISLNRKLIRLPDYLRDYVLLHELTHTKYKHHQPPFWRRLDKCLGAAGIAKKRAKDLREFGIILRFDEE